MTEQRDQSDDPPGVEYRPKQSLRAILRVAEIRVRSTPQLVATVGVMAALATGSFWSTIALTRAGSPLDWRLPAALSSSTAAVGRLGRGSSPARQPDGHSGADT